MIEKDIRQNDGDSGVDYWGDDGVPEVEGYQTRIDDGVPEVEGYQTRIDDNTSTAVPAAP